MNLRLYLIFSFIIIYILYYLYMLISICYKELKYFIYSSKLLDQTISICDKEPEYFIYSSKLIGPTILILGATHGNEPVGYFAIKEYMNMLNRQEIILKKGKIIFIPAVNYCGLKFNTRYNPILGDINRSYGKNINAVNSLIINFVKESDFIIDFHEAYDYNKLNNNSLGSTIMPTDTKISYEVSKYIIPNINSNISEDYKKFDIIQNDGIDYTLRDYISKNLKKDYILVEITGQNDIQPLEVRKNQALTIISSVISYFKMDYN